MPHARLKGLLPPASVAERIFRPGDPAPAPDFDPSKRPLEIRDARAFQADCGSEAACFGSHGFALLDHPTAEREWGADARAREARARVYEPEIAAILRERLFPGRRIEICEALELLCRGRADQAVYADWVHQDFGLTAHDYALNLAGITTQDRARDWRARYECDDVAGFVAISFWRTIGMRAPLRHMPLALCDPASVEMADVIPAVRGADGANYHIGLRFNAEQRWYHYPGMRNDELLAFKLFECRKDDPGPARLRSVFHSAFEDPAAPADAEPRRSCEYRIGVMILADPEFQS